MLTLLKKRIFLLLLLFSNAYSRVFITCYWCVEYILLVCWLQEEEEEADEKEGSSSQAAAQNIGSMGSNSIVAELCSTGIKGT